MLLKSIARSHLPGLRAAVPRAYSSAIANDVKSRGPWYYTNEPIASSQVEKLDAALADYIPSQTDKRRTGEILPKGFHLLFFNDVSRETHLSPDGYHKKQAPDETKFPARMWLGGSLEFNYNAKDQLTVGGAGSAMEEIKDVKYQEKTVKDAVVERIDVTLNRYLYNGVRTGEQMGDAANDWAIKETRSLAYFSPAAGKNREATFTRHIKPPTGATHRLKLTPSNVLLFRYSALTFNSHRIHYDPLYSKEVEGFPDCVVHGPLSLALITNWISSTVLPEGACIKKFTYKNVLPMFVNQELTLCASISGPDKPVTAWIENHRGSLTFTGSIDMEC